MDTHLCIFNDNGDLITHDYENSFGDDFYEVCDHQKKMIDLRFSLLTRSLQFSMFPDSPATSWKIPLCVGENEIGPRNVDVCPSLQLNSSFLRRLLREVFFWRR